jgi:CheY-like chemotaxis protein
MSESTDILLVEDDPGDVHLALAVFRSLQMEERCMVVNDGEEAMAFLKARGRFLQRPPGLPRLILLDLKMPRVNGFDLLRQIKSDVQLKLLPVVVLTSSREERDVERAYDLGVNGYVVKGIDFTDYRGTLQALTKYWASLNELPPALVERRRGVRVRSAAEEDAGSAFAAAGNPWLWPLCPS